MPEVKETIKTLADSMIARFTPPEFWPGCQVMDVTDKDFYTTDNGYIEAIVGPHGQQRVRYQGFPPNAGTSNFFVDVEFFPAYHLYKVFGTGEGGTAKTGGYKVDKVFTPDLSGTVLYSDNGGTVYYPTSDIVMQDNAGTARILLDPGTSSTEAFWEVRDQTGALKLRLSTDNSYRFLVSRGGLDVSQNIFRVDVTGTPQVEWDETNDVFTWNKGHTISAGDILLSAGKVAGTGSSNPDLGASASGNRWGNIYLASATFINGLGTVDISTGAIGSAVTMIRLVNDVQDALKLGGPDGDDVDINFNNGQMFLRGSDGYFGINNTAPLRLLHVGAGASAPTQSSDGVYIAIAGSAQLGINNTTTGVEGGIFSHTDGNVYIGSWSSSPVKIRTNNTNRIDIDSSGNVVINEGSADIDVRIESNNDANLLFCDGGNDAVLIGTSSHASNNKFKVVQTHTDHLSGVFSLETSLTANLSSAATGQTYRGLNFAVQMDGSGGNTGDLTGIVGSVKYNQTSGTLATIQAASFDVRAINAGDITIGYGFRVIPILSSSGNMATWRAIEIRSPSLSSTGGITTAYGVYLAQQEVTGVSTGWGIYQVHANDDNYFEGRVGIGTTGIAAKLHVDQASTTAAIPVATFDQADLSEEFFEFISTVGAGNPIDTAAVGTYYGKIRVSVSGVGFKYMALYNS